MEERPLVSIIVVTYNSSPYVTDTLESVAAQTYSNYELIITDDCSTDNTVEVCRQWIRDHSEVGQRIELILADKNTGVAGNNNRGLAVAKGLWLKFIAGDDMLAPNAIEDYISFVQKNPNVRHLIANAIHFKGSLKDSDFDNRRIVSPFLFREEVTAKYQYSVITKTFFGSGPTYFIHSQTLKEVGGFDERFPMQEDYPLYIKMIGHGYKMELLDAITVYKRMVETSLQYDKNDDAFFSKNQVRIVRDYQYKYREEALPPIWRLLHYYSLFLQNTIIRLGNTKKSLKCKIAFFVYKLTDPFVWYSRFLARKKSRYNRRVNND